MPAEVLLLVAAVKAALLIGAALLLVGSIRRVSAALRHAILLAAMIGALLLPLLSATLPAFSPLSLLVRPVSAIPELGGLRDNALLLLLERSDAGSDLPVTSSLRAIAESWRAGILAFWLAGTAVVLVRIAADLTAARRARSRAASRGQTDSGIPLLESAEIGSPAAVGLLRPAIMLPRGAAAETPDLQSMMAHEQAHIRRRDCLTQLVARLACAAYWFNPLVWHAARRIALERERACDDQVLAAGVDPILYSELLIDMARGHARPPVIRLHGAPSMAQPAHLERRIAGILDARAARRGMSRRRHLALALGTIFIVLPFAALGVEDRPTSADRLDPFRDPQSERAPGARPPDRAVSTTDLTTTDGVLIAVLRDAAKREPRSSYDLVQDRARWALSLARDGRIIGPLLGELLHPDWRVRGYAAWALGVSRDRRAVERLVPLLHDPVWRLRAMTAAALRQIGDPGTAAAMSEALGDPSWQVRVEAVLYLGALREPGFGARVESLRADPHIAVRLAALDALGEIREVNP